MKTEPIYFIIHVYVDKLLLLKMYNFSGFYAIKNKLFNLNSYGMLVLNII